MRKVPCIDARERSYDSVPLYGSSPRAYYGFVRIRSAHTMSMSGPQQHHHHEM